MSSKENLQKEIDSIISEFSNGKTQIALNRTLILIDSHPNQSVLFNLSGACYASLGEISKAIESYKKAILIQPSYARAYFNLAITFHENGDIDEAIKSYENALQLDSNYAEAYNNLANLFKEIGQNDNSIKSFEKALEVRPDYLEACYSLAMIYHEEERYHEAFTKYEIVLKGKKNFSQAWFNYGLVLRKLNKNDEAMKSFEKALALKPDFIEVLNELGNIYSDLGLSKSIEYYEHAINLDNKSAALHFNLGNAHRKIGNFQIAIENYQKALSIEPNYPEVLNNLGHVYKDQGEYDIAIKNFKKALLLDPNYADALNNIGISYFFKGDFDNALESYKEAINSKDDYAEAFANLARLYADLKRYEESLINFEKAIELNPELDNLQGSLLGTKMYMTDWKDFSSQLYALKEKIGQNKKVVDPFTILALEDNPELHLKVAKKAIDDLFSFDSKEIEVYKNHEKIKVGYYSADFKEHPVSFLIAGLFEVHNRENFEIHAFSFGPDTNDDMNLRIKSGVDFFHDIRSKSHVESVELSRSLEIDIAIDLTGHTASARLEIFALRVAPIQIGYIGYLGSMGASFYDYIIADKTIIPYRNQKFYSEKIIYLPSFQVNDFIKDTPSTNLSREELSVPKKSFVFCCFNNTYKITPTTFDSWAKILHRVEGSVIMIFIDNDIAKNNLLKEIKNRGISPERLIFGERLPRADYLARYKVADLFLDTHPYNAGTTASDALRMGLPVITYLGDSFASRMCSSILRAINLSELVCEDQEQYELLAEELAQNNEKMQEIKNKLHENIASSDLFNTRLFAKNIEEAYFNVYKRKKDGLEIDHIYID